MAGRKQPNVIPLPIDATFFFERAVRSLDRCQYDKALKYFRKAAEYEPNNPVNFCNLAGVLSEMGNYGASNEVLRQILEDIDPTMTECYFYLSNNYANMDDFESAERAVLLYLETDTEGHYLAEAEEMIELLSYELGRDIPITFVKSRAGFFEHDKARQQLEEGRFSEACRNLERIVASHPDFLAARNNLALAYYYMGLFEKAMDTVQEVLNREPGNIHALCNRAIFYQQAGDAERLEEMLELLQKTYPYHSDNLFKLATTMGILGDHEAAYRQFKRLLLSGEDHYDTGLYHYAAVASFNTGRFPEARKLWKQAEKLDAKPEIARFFLNLLDSEQTAGVFLSYHYHLPFEEQFRFYEKNRDLFSLSMKNDPLVRSSFFWALRHGDLHTKLQVIQALSAIADQEAEEALRELLLNKEESDYLKRIALFVLRGMGAGEPLEIVLNGVAQMVPAVPYTPGLPVWETEWQTVLELAMQHMRRSYDLLQQFDLETLWVDYLTQLHPSKPRIGKVESWAASLEYLTAKMHRKSVSCEEIALRYGISAATVSRNAKRIDETCGLQRRAEEEDQDRSLGSGILGLL